MINKGSKDVLVSIIIPVFNSEKYLDDCINSIIGQTYTNLEVLIIDNGSTDASLNIVKHYAQNDSRIKILVQNIKGIVRARMLGIENAHGEYICSIDSDDRVEPNYIEVLLNKAMENDADIVQCSYRIEGIKNKDFIFDEYIIHIDDNGHDIISKWLDSPKYIDSQLFTKLFKANIIKQTFKKVSTSLNEGDDKMYFLYYIKATKTIISIKDVLYHYTYRLDSFSHKINFIWLINEIIMIDRLTRIINIQYPLLDKLKVKVWNKSYKKNRINDYINHIKRNDNSNCTYT